MAAPTSPRDSAPPPGIHPLPWRLLGVVLLVALLPRLLWLAGAEVIVAEGSEYARIAENLLAGKGYVGKLAGPERMFPPGYAFAIAGVMSATGLDAPDAARLVSLLGGLTLVALLFALGNRLGGRRVALLTGLSAALLPGLVLSAASAFSESLQLAFLAAGLLLLLPAVSSRHPGRAALAGLAFGLAYQVRVEALPLGLLAAVLLTLLPQRTRLGWRGRWLPGLALAGVLAASTLPYSVYLLEVSGRFGLQDKSARVMPAVERYVSGLSYARANYEIAPDGSDIGPWLRPNEDWEGASSGEIWARSGTRILTETARRAASGAATYLSGHTMGSLLFMLCFLAVALRRKANPEERFSDLWLLGCAGYGLAMYAFYKPVLRYLLPAALASAIWAGRGLPRLVAGWENRRRRRLPDATAVGLAVVLALSAGRGLLTGVREFGESRAHHRDVEEMGRFVATRSEPGPLLSTSPRVAYYSGRTWHPLPWAPTPEALLRRAESEGAHLMVVRRPLSGRDETPGPWYAHGSEAPGWILLHETGRFRVFARR